MSEKIIDVHCAWGPTPAAPYWNDRPRVQEALGQRGITTACLSSSLARRYDPIAGNESVANAINETSDGTELWGWLVGNPDQLAETSNLMRRLLYAEAFVGMALYPDPATGSPVSLESCRELLTVFRRYSKVLLIEALTANAMWHAVEIASFLQTSRVVVSGMGGEEWRQAIDIAAKPSNLFMDFSGALVSEKIQYAITAMAGARKLVFGSGAPGTDPAALLALLAEAGVSSEEREKILYANALRVFGRGTGAVESEGPVGGLKPMGR